MEANLPINLVALALALPGAAVLTWLIWTSWLRPIWDTEREIGRQREWAKRQLPKQDAEEVKRWTGLQYLHMPLAFTERREWQEAAKTGVASYDRAKAND